MVFFALSEGVYGDQNCPELGNPMNLTYGYDTDGHLCWKHDPWMDGLYWSLITVTTVRKGFSAFFSFCSSFRSFVYMSASLHNLHD